MTKARMNTIRLFRYRGITIAIAQPNCAGARGHPYR
jgi:hypothetical protein